MTNLFTIPPGWAMAEVAARHILATVPAEDLSRAIIFLPTRRACFTMRQAFQREMASAVSFLPRMCALSEIDAELPAFVGVQALALTENIPPAMSVSQQRYALMQMVKIFEEKRLQAPVTVEYALLLANDLMQLQDDAARVGVALTQEALRPLCYADVATHWEQSFQFLGILSDYWPALEREWNMTIAPAREAQILTALANYWNVSPPGFPVFAVGSTASHEATTRLLESIARMPQGCVILPGLNQDMAADEWQTITAGHPLYYIKKFLDRLEVAPAAVASLTPYTETIWLEVLSATSSIPNWKAKTLPEHHHIRIIPCTHVEEETRVIALVLREALEMPKKTVALITPDESLMQRVAAHMKRYGVVVDRLSFGTLATTEAGSLWLALGECMANPDRLLLLRHVLQHPAITFDASFVAAVEPYWHGVATHMMGELPWLPEHLRQDANTHALQNLVREMASLSRRQLSASAWAEHVRALMAPISAANVEGSDAVERVLESLADADRLGVLTIHDWFALLRDALSQPWRNITISSHPNISMLTPAEARLQHFDRVIIANMQEPVWPGNASANAWLNMAAKELLGLPLPADHTSLMAHDMLMLGSAAELFLTYPQRDAGSPTTRSRFIERLSTFLAMHGVDEASMMAPHYNAWASMLDRAERFAPEAPVRPLPLRAERPHRLKVTSLDTLFSDPFSVYAAYILNLKPLDAIDAEPEASDFGSLAHRAIQALTEHWNHQSAAASDQEIHAIAEHALRHFSKRPNVALFWRTRLLRALAFVNMQESKRRFALLGVQSEMTVEETLTLADGEAITLHGRIDRMEEGAQGITISDYKTGDAPSSKGILDGKAVQLLAYAMLVEEGGGEVEAVSYWELPHGKKDGELRDVAMAELLQRGLPEQLKAVLHTMLQPETPFLARPLPASERFENDYDGISRYDEWAG